MHKRELETPVLIIDLDIMETNIRDMASAVANAGAILRPMIKTHRCPAIAHLQLEAPATLGIQCAKLGEAEVMAATGIKDIFISNELIGKQKLERLMNLAKRHKISTSIDSLEGARGISAAAQRHNLELDVLIHIDSGNKRSGVLPREPALALAREVTKLEGLNFKGIWTHEGHNYAGRTPEEVLSITMKAGEDMVETKRLIEKELGVAVFNSCGSTPGAKPLAKMPGVDEVRPGTYIFNDGSQVFFGVCQWKDCAPTLLTTVISRPAPDRIITDVGSKSYYPPAEWMSFTKDGSQMNWPLPRTGGGVVKTLSGEIIEDIVFHRWGEEYGIMILYDPAKEIKIGDLLEVIPYHVCSTVNLHDEIVGVRNGVVETIWPVSARGKSL